MWWPSYWIWYARMGILHIWRERNQNKVTFLPSEGAGKASGEVGSSEWQCCLGFSRCCVLQSFSLFCFWHLDAVKICKGELGEHISAVLSVMPTVWVQGIYSPVSELVWLERSAPTIPTDLCSTTYRSSLNCFHFEIRDNLEKQHFASLWDFCKSVW